MRSVLKVNTKITQAAFRCFYQTNMKRTAQKLTGSLYCDSLIYSLSNLNKQKLDGGDVVAYLPYNI